MTTWISFDLDWATGDCRGKTAHKCVKNCDGCQGTLGRADGEGMFPDMVEESFAGMREWLLNLEIAQVVVRDNHGCISRFLHQGDIVYNFDEHSDWEAKGEPVACYNWVYHVEQRGIMVKQYKRMEFPQFDESAKLFIAVSRPYTNESLDGHLFRLLLDLKMPVDFNGGM